MEQFENSIRLRGTMETLPRFSHTNHGKRFCRFTLAVPRLSGTEDLLPVIAEDRVINEMDPCGGGMITVTGQIRSHNYRDQGIRRLLVFVYASAVEAEDGEPINEVVLSGPLCRDPNYRTTPLGREICDIMLAVPRAFHRADYIPCILWGRTAQEASCFHTRDRVQVFGRLQSRSYTKQTDTGAIERTAYEVSALRAEFPASGI